MKRITLVVIAAIVVMLALVGVVYVEMSLSQVTTTTQSFSIVSKPQTEGYITEYPTQANSTNPNGIAVDSNGNVWFILGQRSTLVELITSNGTMREYPLPGAGVYTSLCWGMVYQSSKNAIWFTDDNTNAVYSFNLASDQFMKYALPQPQSSPFGIAVDTQGNVWFAEQGTNRLGEIAASGQLKEVSIPTPSGEPSGVAVDSSGAVWFTLPQLNEIGSYIGGSFQMYNMTGLLRLPTGISADDKGNLWLTEHGPSLIAEFNPASHYFKSFSTTIPAFNSSYPYFDYLDSSGNVWFNEHYGNAIAEFNPSTNTLVEYEIPTRVAAAQNISGALTMYLSPAGVPWFTEIFSGRVGTVNVPTNLPLGISVTNSTVSPNTVLPLASGGSISLPLSVTNSISESVELRASVGNLSGFHFDFAFSPSSGSGNFQSKLMITDYGSAPGVYFVTLGAETSDVIVSTIIEIQVT